MSARTRWFTVKIVTLLFSLLLIVGMGAALSIIPPPLDDGGSDDGVTGDDNDDIGGGPSCSPSCGSCETCDGGSCTPKPSAECTTDSDCSEGYECSGCSCEEKCPADDEEWVEGHGCAPVDRECIQDSDCSQDQRQRTCSDYECTGSHASARYNGEYFTGAVCAADGEIWFTSLDDYGWLSFAGRYWDDEDKTYSGEIATYECDSDEVCYDWREDSFNDKGADGEIGLEVDANCFGVSVSTSMPEYTDGNEPIHFDVGGLYDGG